MNPAQPGIAFSRTDARTFFDKILSIFPNDADCNFMCSLRGSCDKFIADIPSLSFTIDDVTYNLPAEAFTYFTGGNYGACKIIVGAHHADESLVILGDSFLQQFQPTLDFDDNTLSFVIADDAASGVSFTTVGVNEEATTNGSGLQIVGTFSAVLAVGAALFIRSLRAKHAGSSDWQQA